MWSRQVVQDQCTPILLIQKVLRSKQSVANTKTDPEERNNLASTMPEVLMEMQAKLANYQATYFNCDRIILWPGACDVAIGGSLGPFLDWHD